MHDVQVYFGMETPLRGRSGGHTGTAPTIPLEQTSKNKIGCLHNLSKPQKINWMPAHLEQASKNRIEYLLGLSKPQKIKLEHLLGLSKLQKINWMPAHLEQASKNKIEYLLTLSKLQKIKLDVCSP